MSEEASERQPGQSSNSEERGLQQPAREVESRHSDTFLSLYANNVQIRLTPFDVQLMFGEILSADERKLVIEHHLAVNLSPQTAKSLFDVLSRQIRAYERQFGEIRYNPIQQSSEDTTDPGVTL